MSDRFELKSTGVHGHYLHDTGSGRGTCVNLSKYSAEDEEYCEEYMQAIADCLNKHMPPKKKSFEDFLAMSDADLSDAVSNIRNSGHPYYATNMHACHEYLRPAILEMGFAVTTGINHTTEKFSWKLWEIGDYNDYVASSVGSTSSTLPRFYCASYLWAQQEKGK